MVEEEADNQLGSKGNYCQKSLVYTDICGIDGKKYLCEVAFAKRNKDFEYGYLWEDIDNLAVEYNKTHSKDTNHYCLYYCTQSKVYDNAMEILREKYHRRKEALERLKNSKKMHLKTLIKNDERIWRLANDYYKR